MEATDLTFALAAFTLVSFFALGVRELILVRRSNTRAQA